MTCKSKVCPKCGVEHNNKRSDYCCKRFTKECLVCGDSFETICNNDEKDNCDSICLRYRNRTITKEIKNEILSIRNDRTFSCQMCGVKFVQTRRRKDGIVGCSKICVFQLKEGNRKCLMCDKKFAPRSKKQEYCSKRCSGLSSQSDKSKKKRRETVRTKYGVDSVLQAKEIQEKVRKTQEEKYGGIGFASKKTGEKIRETNLLRYGVENVAQSGEIKRKIEKTNLERYGVRSVLSSEVIKSKVRSTNLSKYGTEHPLRNKEVMNRLQETNLERYGHKCSLHNENMKKKTQKTVMRKYGVKSILQSKEIRDKIEKTNLSKYGVKNPFQSEEVKDEIKEINKKRYGAENYSNRETLEEEMLERDDLVVDLYNNGKTEYEIAEIMNYEYITVRRVLLRRGVVTPKNITKPNKYWAHLIKKKLGIAFKHEGAIFTNKRMKVDLYNKEYKIGIDINPTITHSTQETPFPYRKTTKVKYHQDRAIDAQQNGWELIQVFDWDSEGDIIELLRSKFNMNERIYARKCSVKEIDNKTSRNFLNEHHRQQGKANSSIQYGLFFEGELIQVMTFSKERFSRNKKKDSYELLRLTSKRGMTVVGGASKLLKAFQRSDYRPQSIKTFADFSKGTGKSYEKMGMIYDGFANMNAFYSNIYTEEAYKATEVTNKFKDKYSKLGLTQKEYMNSKNFYRINDAGHKIFRWNR